MSSKIKKFFGAVFLTGTLASCGGGGGGGSAPSAPVQNALHLADRDLVLDDLDGELRSAVELEGLFARLLFDLVAAEPAFFFHLEDFRRTSRGAAQCPGRRSRGCSSRP